MFQPQIRNIAKNFKFPNEEIFIIINTEKYKIQWLHARMRAVVTLPHDTRKFYSNIHVATMNTCVPVKHGAHVLLPNSVVKLPKTSWDLFEHES